MPRKAYLLSALLHIVVLVVLLVPFSWARQDPLPPRKPIPIVPMPVAKKSTAPGSQVRPPIEKKPEPPRPEKPKPQPKPEPQPEPKVEPKIEPKPLQPAPPKKVDKPTPKPQEKPKPQKADKPKKEEKPKKKKKKNEDDFLSVLKTVEDLDTPLPDLKDLQDDAPSTDGPKSDMIDDKLSMSELDALKQQLSQCWGVPAGAKGAEDLSVVIEVNVGSDGVVQKATVVDAGGRRGDPFYDVAAESARRAFYHPDCTPLLLPKDKFEEWRSFKILFNPKEMFG